MALKREDLLQMSIKRLRQLDISEPEDEAVVQDLIQEKLASQPIVGLPARAAAHATDNLTPEKEAELQKVIDAQNAARKAARTAPVESPEVADQQREDEVAEKLAELEAEKAKLDAASQEPFVPEATEPGPLPEPGAEAPVTEAPTAEAPVTEAPTEKAPEVAPAPVTRTPRAPRGGNKKK